MSSLVSDAKADDVINEAGLWEKISYTWVITNVESYFENVTARTASPSFYSKQREYEWHIRCYFSSLSVPVVQRYLSAHLCADKMPNDAVETKYTLSLKNSGDGVIKIKRDVYHLFKTGESWGFAKFIKWPDLLSSIPDKILKIHVEVLIKVHSFDMEYHVINLGSDSPEPRLQKSMDELFESSNFTDVVFKVEEAKLKAHKCILSTRSPVFAAMFTHESIEKHSGVVKIVDFDSDSFKLFLRFVYTGRVDIASVEVATDLFRAAEKYDFPDLKALCIKFIPANLNSSNIGSCLLLAETFIIKDLKKIAMNYMLENLKNFKDAEMEVYKVIEEQNPKLLTELLTMVAEKLDKIDL